MIASMSRGAALVIAAAVVVVAGLAMFRPSAEADPGEVAAPYLYGATWPDDMTWLCVEDQTHGFPVEEAAAEFAEFVDMQVHDQCPDGAYTVRVGTTNDPEWLQGAQFDGERRDDGLLDGGTITLNLAHAYKQDPRKWRVLLVHELGHAVGLGHTNEHDSVMKPYGEMYIVDGLTEIDRQQLAEIYDD